MIFKPEASSSGVGVGGVGVLGGAGTGRLEAIAAAAGYLPETQDMYCQPSFQFVDSPLWERRDLREAACRHF